MYFDVKGTTRRSFYYVGVDSVECEKMRQTGTFGYFNNECVKALSMNYNNFSLVCLLTSSRIQ